MLDKKKEMEVSPVSNRDTVVDMKLVRVRLPSPCGRFVRISAEIGFACSFVRSLLASAVQYV